jgi:hypothetical protein
LILSIVQQLIAAQADQHDPPPMQLGYLFSENFGRKLAGNIAEYTVFQANLPVAN